MNSIELTRLSRGRDKKKMQGEIPEIQSHQTDLPSFFLQNGRFVIFFCHMEIVYNHTEVSVFPIKYNSSCIFFLDYWFILSTSQITIYIHMPWFYIDSVYSICHLVTRFFIDSVYSICHLVTRLCFQMQFLFKHWIIKMYYKICVICKV